MSDRSQTAEIAVVSGKPWHFRFVSRHGIRRISRSGPRWAHAILRVWRLGN